MNKISEVHDFGEVIAVWQVCWLNRLLSWTMVFFFFLSYLFFFTLVIVHVTICNFYLQRWEIEI